MLDSVFIRTDRAVFPGTECPLNTHSGYPVMNQRSKEMPAKTPGELLFFFDELKDL